MYFSGLGFLIASFGLAAGASYFGLWVFKFITCWTLNLHIVTLFYITFVKSSGETARILLILSWTLGICISILFWIYYLFVGYDSPVPLWLDSLLHGGVAGMIIIQTFMLKPIFRLQDIKWPIGFYFTWFFTAAVPLRLLNIEIYPDFLFKLQPTIGFFIGFMGPILFGFFVGLAVFGNSKKKIN